jgi:hypothetical protein
MKLYSASVMSVLLGKAILKFLAGLLIFTGLRRIATPWAGLWGAIWFYLFFQDFFYTYNHIGGIVAVTAVTAMLLSHIRKPSGHYLWTTSGISFILCFIKLNFGLAALVLTAAFTFTTDRMNGQKNTSDRNLFYRTTLIYLPIIVAAVYLLLLHGLTVAEIRQCLPYAAADHPYNANALTALSAFWKLFTQKFFTSGLDFAFGCVVICALIRISWLAVNRKLADPADRKLVTGLVLLGAYFVLNFHEYLASGTWYTSLWSQPLAFMFFFTAIALAIRRNIRSVRILAWSVIAVLAFLGWRDQSAVIANIRTPAQYLAHPRIKAYVTNHPDWAATLTSTADFLDRNLEPGENFFALPYDPIYYFLTGRQSPVQLLIFFEHINIRREQEEKIIADLERQKIRWIVVSSRMRTAEPGLGTLGKTYCPLIAQYIDKNFTPAAQFGDWKNPGGWGWNHGTLILKRK